MAIGPDKEIPMSKELEAKIDALDDKNAIYVVQKLTQAAFKGRPEPTFQTMAQAIDQARAPGQDEPRIANHEEWSKLDLVAGQGGRVARAVLLGWAADPGLAPAVDKAIDTFKSPRQDMGLLSVPVALGLTYVLIGMDLELDLGFIKVKKKGLTGAQQTAVVKRTIEPVLKTIRVLAGT
jgi:hypothetical protein